MLVAIAGIFLLRTMGLDSLVPYVDPMIVLVAGVITTLVPVRMSRDALIELLNRAPTKEVVQGVNDILDANLLSIPVKERLARVTQPGRRRMVWCTLLCRRTI